MSDLHSLELHAGVAALRRLMEGIKKISNDTVLPPDFEDEEDPPDCRDYRTIAALIAASIDKNMIAASSRHREGYLRAVTDLLCIVADGGIPSWEVWTPIRNTAKAFDEGATHG